MPPKKTSADLLPTLPVDDAEELIAHLSEYLTNTKWPYSERNRALRRVLDYLKTVPRPAQD
jgi:hypothetical protein